MSKRGKPKMTYPKESEAKLKDANRKLRAEVKRLKNTIKEQNKKIKQYNEVLAKNFEHVEEMMEDVSVEDAILMANRNKKAKAKPDTKELVRQQFREMFKGKKK